MRIRLNLSLRRALLAAMACVTAYSSFVYAGIADASKYFNTFDMGQYYLTFTDYSFSITAGVIPEPTTASLSLLALAALAMRRRRK